MHPKRRSPEHSKDAFRLNWTGSFLRENQKIVAGAECGRRASAAVQYIPAYTPDMMYLSRAKKA